MSQRDMIAFIQKQYAEKLTLGNIATAGRISKSKCCRIFKTYLQQTPIDFLNTYRLEISSNLLADTEEPVLEIANACGFSSQSYFTKLFQEKFSLTPTAYRKAKREA
ncbi:MAG: AraC family transcriptional regulator [Dialister sp.]|nr:AraC family transcriptional regulator [Dialister sp.]